MALEDVVTELRNMAHDHRELAEISMDLADQLQNMTLDTVVMSGGSGFFITGLTIFALACFVGYYVVWKVTPALHSPLMAVTNAVSSVIIVGALVAAGHIEMGVSKWMGLAAVTLASINIFGGFIVTERMLAMYKKKATVKEKAKT